MIRRLHLLALPAALLVAAAPLAAQRDSVRTTQGGTGGQMPADMQRAYQAAGQPDVFLNIPNLKVREINLEVNNLRARLNLEARLANLLSLNAGADVAVDRVNLRISGVEAQAMLVVRLDNVRAIIDRTLTTLDRNPELVARLLQSVDNTVGTVGGVANTALQPGGVVSQTVGTLGQTLDNLTRPGGVLTQTVNTLGQTVQTTLDTSGRLVERTLDATGGVVNTRTLGALTSLPVIGQTTNQAGQTVRQVRTQAGQTVEYVVDSAGRVLGARMAGAAATGGTGTTPRP